MLLNNITFTDEQLDNMMIENNQDNKEFTNKLLKTIEKYKDNTTATIARVIGKHCNRESINNISKRRNLRRQTILNELEKEKIETKISTEQRICLILDNYSAHKSIFIKKVAKILNITLIFLPPYSPQLNPIEQLWRQMKNEIQRQYLESKEFLKDLTIKTFNETIKITNVYDTWYQTFITEVW